MPETKTLKSSKDFGAGCRVYQSGLKAVNQGKWPVVQENSSLTKVLKETQSQPIRPMHER